MAYKLLNCSSSSKVIQAVGNSSFNWDRLQLELNGIFLIALIIVFNYQLLMRHVSKEERERVRWLNGMMKRDIKQKPLHTYIHTLLQQANGKLLSISVCV